MDIRTKSLSFLAAGVAVAVSIALLQKLRAGDKVVDRSLIGKTGDITKTVERGRAGTVRIEGRELAARSSERIEAGSFGEVVAIDGKSVEVVQVPALSSHTTGYHMMEM
jgi:membrane-bound ClpP family serine protease